jgi:hypothetical protein
MHLSVGEDTGGYRNVHLYTLGGTSAVDKLRTDDRYYIVQRSRRTDGKITRHYAINGEVVTSRGTHLRLYA